MSLRDGLDAERGRTGSRDVREMLAAQDRPTVRPGAPDGDDDGELTAGERAALREMILGSWEPDAFSFPGDSPEDRLRMQDQMGDFE